MRIWLNQPNVSVPGTETNHFLGLRQWLGKSQVVITNKLLHKYCDIQCALNVWLGNIITYQRPANTVKCID